MSEVRSLSPVVIPGRASWRGPGMTSELKMHESSHSQEN